MADAQVDTSTPSAQYHAYPHPPATGTDSPPSYPGDSGAVAAVNAAAGPSPEHEGQQNDGEVTGMLVYICCCHWQHGYVLKRRP